MELEGLEPVEREALLRHWKLYVRNVGGPEAEEHGGKFYRRGWLDCLAHLKAHWRLLPVVK